MTDNLSSDSEQNFPNTHNDETLKKESVKKEEGRDWEQIETRKANKISRTGMYINLALFLITLFAFWETKRSVDITKDSLNEVKDKIAFLMLGIRCNQFKATLKIALVITGILYVL
ncbi:MAG TPA: hypothetical protein VGP55_03720 [Chitinophagaceae bacterium]|nr:hypothetical protein [Chitinophagaceae bacterium]